MCVCVRTVVRLSYEKRTFVTMEGHEQITQFPTSLVQVPPVVRVHPQLKIEANWLQRIIQGLLAPSSWQQGSSTVHEMNAQRHIVKLKTAMAQAVVCVLFQM